MQEPTTCPLTVRTCECRQLGRSPERCRFRKFEQSPPPRAAKTPSSSLSRTTLTEALSGARWPTAGEIGVPEEAGA